MTPSELKYRVESANPGSFFFSRGTMRFFGDTMRNYGVRSKPVELRTLTGETVLCFELYRKKPVKHGLTKSAHFHIVTYRQVFGE